MLAIGRTIGALFPAAEKTYLFSNTSRRASLHLDSIQWVLRTLSQEKVAEAWFWSHMNVFPWWKMRQAALPRGAWDEDTSPFTFNELIVHIYAEYNKLLESG